jgi:hypothetical protein
MRLIGHSLRLHFGQGKMALVPTVHPRRAESLEGDVVDPDIRAKFPIRIAIVGHHEIDAELVVC